MKLEKIDGLSCAVLPIYHLIAVEGSLRYQILISSGFPLPLFQVFNPGNESTLMRTFTIVPVYDSYGTTRAGQCVNYPNIQSIVQRNREQRLS